MLRKFKTRDTSARPADVRDDRAAFADDEVANMEAIWEPANHLDSFYVAGFQYTDGCNVIDELRPGTPLALVPEPSNPYDANAVVIAYQGMRLGYIPADKNGKLALLLHFGHTNVVGCKVVQADPTAEPHRQLKVKMFVRDAR